jgi:hypothetical protein
MKDLNALKQTTKNLRDEYLTLIGSTIDAIGEAIIAYQKAIDGDEENVFVDEDDLLSDVLSLSKETEDNYITKIYLDDSGAWSYEDDKDEVTELSELSEEQLLSILELIVDATPDSETVQTI